MVCLIAWKIIVIVTATHAIVMSIPTSCTPNPWKPPPTRRPFQPVPAPSEKRPTARVPKAPFNPWTPTAPTGSSTLSTLSINSIPNTTTKPEIIPMIAADTGDTVSHPAVIATRPARDPFRDMETSGFLYLTHVMSITATVATAAARFVVTKILPALTIASPSMLTVDAPLNPNQQNQRMNTPKAPMVRL